MIPPSIFSRQGSPDNNKSVNNVHDIQIKNSGRAHRDTVFDRLVPLTDYAANTLIVPAVTNNPITTSICRPLVISQSKGQMPQLSHIYSTKGWGESNMACAMRYLIADACKMKTSQCLYGVKNTVELPEEEKQTADMHINALSSLIMALLTQPIKVMKTNRQVSDSKIKESLSKYLQTNLAIAYQRPFHGVAGNFLSGFLNFSLDTNDRNLLKAIKDKKVTTEQATCIQFIAGAGVGVINNFVKTHAQRRELGESHEKIFQAIKHLARHKPQLLGAQLLYSALAGSFNNLLWANTIRALHSIDRWVKQRAE